jgi:hypothetical protein
MGYSHFYILRELVQRDMGDCNWYNNLVMGWKTEELWFSSLRMPVTSLSSLNRANGLWGPNSEVK